MYSLRPSENMVIDTNPEEIYSSQEVSVDLEGRTWQSLDFQVVMDGLAKACQTEIGRQLAVDPRFAESLEEVHRRYETVEEIWDCVDPVPLRSGMDIEKYIKAATSGTILEIPELREVSQALESLDDLQRWLEGTINEKATIPRLKELGEPIYLDPELVEILKDSFDDEGELSGSKFPKLSQLRRSISDKKSKIRSMMQSLLSSNEFTSMLADNQVQEFDGRFVVAVKPTYKRNVGIVHDTSRTGKTIYVEPAQVVEPTNELKELSLQLKVEEARILTQMTLQVTSNEKELRESLAAAAEIDLACARARLGLKLGATVPIVKMEGEIHVVEAKNPVLTLLKGDSAVVGNDISITKDVGCLVLTGPNAGGKTVVLKTLGVLALMVRSGIPLPCSGRKPRFDFFPTVLADIGDLQSVSNELSTFSGHLMVCKAVLDNSKEGSLVLMDEMGSGTDPSQGAALAQSLLETLLENGARIAITTHYLQLKELAANDPKYAVAAMQFIDGRPTYRMIQGAIGESFALAVAERLNLPNTVIERARLLLDENERKVSDLIRELEEERDNLRIQGQELDMMKLQVQGRENELTELKQKAEKEISKAKQTVSKEYAKKMNAIEKKLKDLVDQLKETPDVDIVGESLDEVRLIKQEVIKEAEKATENRELVALPAKYPLEDGDWVYVMAKGYWYNKPGKVEGYAGRNRVSLDMGNGQTERFKVNELSLPPEGSNPEESQQHKKKVKKKDKFAGVSRKVRALLEEEEAASVGMIKAGTKTASREKKDIAVRTEQNTLNVIGKRFEEAEREVDFFFSDCLVSGWSTCYILHGHGTGQLKRGLRESLRKNPLVRSAKPASAEDGGDALTIVRLKA